VIDPRVAFGRLVIAGTGVATRVLAEWYQAGDSIDDLADDYSCDIMVEIHGDHFDQGAADVDWLPEVGRQGWIVLTKDANIGKRTLEKIAVAQSHIKWISRLYWKS
jgi:PIN like domain/Protein of unknown function (DUF433)